MAVLFDAENTYPPTCAHRHRAVGFALPNEQTHDGQFQPGRVRVATADTHGTVGINTCKCAVFGNPWPITFGKNPRTVSRPGFCFERR